jgi:hypothetical protein
MEPVYTLSVTVRELVIVRAVSAVDRALTPGTDVRLIAQTLVDATAGAPYKVAKSR